MPNNPDEQFMQQRLLIASVLSAVALMGYMYVQGPPPAPPEDPSGIEQPTTGGAVDPEPEPPEAVPGTNGAPPDDPPETPGAANPGTVQATAAKAETEALIETDTFKVRFSNRGAVAKSWVFS